MTPGSPGRVVSPARLGGRIFPESEPCQNCHAPVRRINGWPGHEHHDPDASFNDSVWRYCRLTVAQPRVLSAAQRKAAEVYDALVEMQARPATGDVDATVLIEAASFVAAVRDGRAVLS